MLRSAVLSCTTLTQILRFYKSGLISPICLFSILDGCSCGRYFAQCVHDVCVPPKKNQSSCTIRLCRVIPWAQPIHTSLYSCVIAEFSLPLQARRRSVFCLPRGHEGRVFPAALPLLPLPLKFQHREKPFWKNLWAGRLHNVAVLASRWCLWTAAQGEVPEVLVPAHKIQIPFIFSCFSSVTSAHSTLHLNHINLIHSSINHPLTGRYKNIYVIERLI